VEVFIHFFGLVFIVFKYFDIETPILSNHEKNVDVYGPNVLNGGVVDRVDSVFVDFQSASLVVDPERNECGPCSLDQVFVVGHEFDVSEDVVLDSLPVYNWIEFIHEFLFSLHIALDVRVVFTLHDLVNQVLQRQFLQREQVEAAVVLGTHDDEFAVVAERYFAQGFVGYFDVDDVHHVPAVLAHVGRILLHLNKSVVCEGVAVALVIRQGNVGTEVLTRVSLEVAELDHFEVTLVVKTL